MSTEVENEKKPDESKPKKPKKGFFRRLFKFCFYSVLVLVLLAVTVRPFLPRAILWYVNKTLNQSPLYQGKIDDIDLHIWRGAYSIRNVRILKTTGNIPVPFFQAKSIDLAIEWNALLKRKVVGRFVVDTPEINYVSDPSTGESQTGGDGPWLKIISDLFPFDINSAHIEHGSVHFRTYAKAKPVDVFLSQMSIDVDDLTNVSRSVTPLLTTIDIKALAMDQARFELHMKLNPFSYNPTFHMGMRLLGLDITKTNDLIEAFGYFTVKKGFFDLVLDVDSDEGQLTGYIKPLFRNMVIFDLSDLKEDDPLRAFWQLIVGGVAGAVTNFNRDQIATLVPFTGTMNGPQVEILPAIGNVLKNAFIRAYLPRLEREYKPSDDLQFGPGQLSDPVSVGNDQ